MLGAIARGLSQITNLAPGADVAATVACFRALGVSIREVGPGAIAIDGRGWPGLRAAEHVLDAANSGTTLRLMSGLLAGRPFQTTISGDSSLRRRPMARVIEPLTHMGATIEADGGKAPLTIHGTRLTGINWRPPVASAQIKSALMFAGLSASGTTSVIEVQPTRDHSELAFPCFGLAVDVDADGLTVRVAGGQEAEAPHVAHLQVPGDPSTAAVWATAASALPGSTIVLRNVCLNPRRTGFISALTALGAEVSVNETHRSGGEAVGTLEISHRGHGSLTIGAADVPDLIDELPILAARAALGGELSVSGASELRVKESDRITALVSGLQALGVDADEHPDGFHVRGNRRPTGGIADAAHDHRLVMAFTIVGLGASGSTTITGAEAVAVSYPSFAADLALLTS
jgi:3-phosphoshikimate 1-carboxyvinyltransferase